MTDLKNFSYKRLSYLLPILLLLNVNVGVTNAYDLFQIAKTTQGYSQNKNFKGQVKDFLQDQLDYWFDDSSANRNEH